MKTRRFITLLLAMILSLGMIVHVSAVAVPELPTAKVTEVIPLATGVPIYDLSGSPTGEKVDIEAEYCFEPDDPSQEQLDYYGSWYADYRVSFDRPILKESFGLYGEYSGYGTEFSVAFLFPIDVAVGDSILLLQSIGMDGAVTYQDCVKNIEKFYCGVFNKSYDNIGTTMTVELVIRDPEGSSDNWITVESVDYTFVGPALPEAVVEELIPETGLPLYDIDTFTPTGEIVKELEAEYKFTPVEPTQAQLDYYGSWKADYRVSFDTEILKHTFGLYGAYNGYGKEFSVAFLFPIDEKQPFSVPCFVANVPVKNGFISSRKKIGMESSLFDMQINGDVDLGKETIDVKMDFSPRSSGVLKSVFNSVSIAGILAYPKISINTDKAFDKALSIGMAFFMGGKQAAQEMIKQPLLQNVCADAMGAER